MSELTTAASEDVDDADEDEPGAHDFYVRVGARWSKGDYYERLKGLLS